MLIEHTLEEITVTVDEITFDINITVSSNAGIPDAPADGKMYARMNNQWVEITGVTPSPSSIEFEIVDMEVITETDPNTTMAITNGDLIVDGYQGGIELIDGELILS